MPLRKTLRTDLVAARKAQDPELVSLIRTLIAAIENAEAVDVVEHGAASEVPRRHLSDDDIMVVILREGDDLRQAADEYEKRGNAEEALRLGALSEVADRYAQTFDRSRT